MCLRLVINPERGENLAASTPRKCEERKMSAEAFIPSTASYPPYTEGRNFRGGAEKDSIRQFKGKTMK